MARPTKNDPDKADLTKVAYITPDGMKRIQAELRFLLGEERPRVVREVTVAAAHGDRSENAEYIYGKRRLREIDRRVRFLAKRVDNSEIVDPMQQRTDRVVFGVVVTLEDDTGEQKHYQIVGPDDQTSASCISYRSPIGAALLGKRVDDELTVQTPGGARWLVVLEINRPAPK
jgi:transcription elongation factor GreB